jgi:hypothetical protein
MMKFHENGGSGHNLDGMCVGLRADGRMWWSERFRECFAGKFLFTWHY